MPTSLMFVIRKGTNGVSTNGFPADFKLFGRGTFWVLPLTLFHLPKSATAYLFLQSIKIHGFCSGPISVDPICPQSKGSTSRRAIHNNYMFHLHFIRKSTSQGSHFIRKFAQTLLLIAYERLNIPSKLRKTSTIIAWTNNKILAHEIPQAQYPVARADRGGRDRHRREAEPRGPERRPLDQQNIDLFKQT